MFAYGTLRGDYSEDGDRWGVIKSTQGKWDKAYVCGFRLYQDRKKPFPFAVRTGRSEDVLWGTLITWPGGVADARQGIACAERFEMDGYDHGYSRHVASARVTPADAPEGEVVSDEGPPVLCYLFHLTFPAEALAKCHVFSSGDWMRPVNPPRGGTGNVEAMFAYGRFRGDYEGGPTLEGTWREAVAVGFRLYKEHDQEYPFAVYTGNEQDVLHGTLLTFPGTEEATRALASVSEIEGIIEARPLEGTYRRTVTEVSWAVAGGGHSTMLAFIYYQEWPPEYLSQCQAYVHGDWIRDHLSL